MEHGDKLRLGKLELQVHKMYVNHFCRLLKYYQTFCRTIRLSGYCYQNTS